MNYPFIFWPKRTLYWPLVPCMYVQDQIDWPLSYMWVSDGILMLHCKQSFPWHFELRMALSFLDKHVLHKWLHLLNLLIVHVFHINSLFLYYLHYQLPWFSLPLNWKFVYCFSSSRGYHWVHFEFVLILDFYLPTISGVMTSAANLLSHYVFTFIDYQQQYFLYILKIIIMLSHYLFYFV